MIKSIFSAVGKIVVAGATYVLELIAGIMYILGTIANAITEVLFRLPGAAIAFLIIVTIIESVYMLMDPFFASKGGLGGANIFFMFFFIGIACFLIGTVGSILCSFLAVVFTVINPMYAAAVCNAGATRLMDTYLKIDGGDAEPWLSIIAFPHAISGWGNLIFGIVGKVAAWVGMPVLFGWGGYWATFIDCAPPDAGTVEFWCSVALVATFAIMGLYFGSVVSKLVAMEDRKE